MPHPKPRRVPNAQAGLTLSNTFKMNPTIKPLSLHLALSLAVAPPGAADTRTPEKPDLYAVPALSSIPRMPDRIPSDAVTDRTLRMTAAKGEYEPVSFLIHPRSDLPKLEMKATALTGQSGTIPAEEIDIKLVKVWYQAGTGWYSYFADTARRELIPELLLNDDSLIRVDHEKKENYLRVGKEYRSISYPASEATEGFNYLVEPVADSETLQPVNLKAGQNQQVWITVRVPKETPEGVYQGEVQLWHNGKALDAVKLLVRVLPFELPDPKTYYNLENDYLVTLYSTSVLTYKPELFGTTAKALESIQTKIFENLRKHNISHPRLSTAGMYAINAPETVALMKREFALMKAAGFSTKPLITDGWSYPKPNEMDNPERTHQRIDGLDTALRELVDHDDIYVSSWDEAGPDRIRIMREVQEYTAKHGLKLWMTTHKERHFEMAGYLIDFANHGGFADRENVRQWHTVGAKVGSYAGPHTGPENPDVFRRWEGFARYKENYDASFNYKYFSQLHSTLWKKNKQNVWNDFAGGTFRQFNLVYPTPAGMIDTIAWEGFREGIDDVRYATKLKQEAERAIREGDVDARLAAKKALMKLELMDGRTADLNHVRQEMIESILGIRAAMKK